MISSLFAQSINVLDPDFIQRVLQMGVGGAIAWAIFVLYRRDIKSYVDLWTAQTKRSDAAAAAMMQVVRENTAALVENSQILRSLHRRMDAWEGIPRREAHAGPRPVHPDERHALEYPEARERRRQGSISA